MAAGFQHPLLRGCFASRVLAEPSACFCLAALEFGRDHRDTGAAGFDVQRVGGLGRLIRRGRLREAHVQSFLLGPRLYLFARRLRDARAVLGAYPRARAPVSRRVRFLDLNRRLW